MRYCIKYKIDVYQNNKQKTYLVEITALPGVMLLFGKIIVDTGGLSSCYAKNL